VCSQALSNAYPQIAGTMPKPADLCPGFIAEPGRCWRMVYSKQLQATHCNEPVAWRGRYRSPKGDKWWTVWACGRHTDGLVGIRKLRMGAL
jgi:hypothetical protein